MKYHKAIGTCLIVFGILLALALIVLQFHHCMDMWTNDYKPLVFDSFLEYFFSVSKGALLLSLGIGIVFTCEGIHLCRKAV